jgi:hypothetical protein
MTAHKIQYIAVFVILAAVTVWIIWSLLRRKSAKHSGCCGCGLADACKGRRNPQSQTDDSCCGIKSRTEKGKK